MALGTLEETVVVARRSPPQAPWQGERVARVALLGAAAVVLSVIAGASSEKEHPAAAILVLLLPTIPLAVGMASIRGNRALASALLLGAVPAALGFAALLRGGIAVDPWLTMMWASTLLAFVVQAAQLLAAADGALATGRNAAQEIATRLHRRDLIYTCMQLVTVAAFVVPLLVALLAPTRHRLISTAVATLLGVIACRAFLIDLFARHLQGDEPLRETLSQLRRHARRGRPSWVFYVASAAALVAMVLFASRGLLNRGTP